MKYFIASRWRNKKSVEELTAKLRNKGATVFNFFEKENNMLSGENPEKDMEEFEAIKDWRHDPRIKGIFDADIDLLKRCENFILLLPVGNSAHIEAGIAYGLNKKLIVIGQIDKAESHYPIFNEFYDSIDGFVASFTAT